MAATSNGMANGTSQPKIHLYTNHGCPFAHRAHIALEELGLPFEETIIDLDTPRPQWYLDINPRGLVPSIKLTLPGSKEEQILYESAIVSRFLSDLYPSHLLPTSTTPEGALKRARIDFLLDTWNTKIGSYQITIMKTPAAEKESKVDEMVAAVKEHIEPLLSDAAPFFGGSDKLTFAEVILAPFILRLYVMAEDGTFAPNSLVKKLGALPKFSAWAEAMRKHGSVTKIFDGEGFVRRFGERYGGTMEKTAS